MYTIGPVNVVLPKNRLAKTVCDTAEFGRIV